MIARAACDHVDAVDEVELLERKPELVDIELARGAHAAHERIAHDAGLLADLLEHEVGIAALLRHVHVPVDVRHRGLDGAALLVGIRDALRGEAGELAILEHDHVARRVDKRDDVGGDVAAPLPAPDDDGAVLAGDRDHAGLVRADRRDAVGAHDVRAGLAQGVDDVALTLRGSICLLDEMRDDLGVGIASELMAAPLEFLAQLGEVLDDAVVHDGDPAVAAHVRVRVRHARLPVRRPTRMTDTAGRGVVATRELALEAIDLAHAAHHVEACRTRAGVAVLQRHAGRIVPAVLEALEPREQDVLGRIRSGVSDDSAHMRYPFDLRAKTRPRSVRHACGSVSGRRAPRARTGRRGIGCLL